MHTEGLETLLKLELSSAPKAQSLTAGPGPNIPPMPTSPKKLDLLISFPLLIQFLIKHTCAASVFQPPATVGVGSSRHGAIRAGQAFLSPPLSVPILEPVPSFLAPHSQESRLSPSVKGRTEPGPSWFPTLWLCLTQQQQLPGWPRREGTLADSRQRSHVSDEETKSQSSD